MPVDIGGVATLTSPAGTTLSMDSAAAVNWMNVNANGILNRPQTPYFRGYVQGKTNPYNAGGGALLVTPLVNIGNCWNEATGLWTCPVAGYYMTTMFSICGPTGSGYPRVQKNGADQRYTHWNHSGSWHNVTLSGVILCAASDTIRWTLQSLTPATAGVYGGAQHAMYCIALMA